MSTPRRGTSATAWRKSLKILHLSDLNFATRAAGSGRRPCGEVLDPTAIEAAAAGRARGAPPGDGVGFDYVVVAGNHLGRHEPAGTEQHTRELKTLLRSLLRHKPDAHDSRILLVPGPGDPKDAFLPTILPLEDITLVAVDFSTRTSVPTRAELTRLHQQLTSALDGIRGDARDYIQSTPTLLVSSGALILNEATDPEIAAQIIENLAELRVTLHLFGKHPVFCYCHSPFLPRFLSLGTGAALLARRRGDGAAELPQYQANLITLDLAPDTSPARPMALRQSISVTSLRWLNGGWTAIPLVSNDSPAFFPKASDADIVRPVHPKILAEIRAVVATGTRYIHVSGLPGSGRRALFDDLRHSAAQTSPEFDLGCKVECMKIEYDNLDAQTNEIKRLAAEQKKRRAGRVLLIVAYDREFRDTGATQDRVEAARRSLIGALDMAVRQSGARDDVAVLHLVHRVEDRPNPASTIDRQHAIVLTATRGESGGVAEVERRYRRAVPLADKSIDRLIGPFPGFAETLIREINRGFSSAVAAHGNRNAADVARDLVDPAADGRSSKVLANQFVEGIGPLISHVVPVLLQTIETALGADAGRPGRIRISDVRSRLGDETLDDSLRTAFKRLRDSDLVWPDADDADLYWIHADFPRLPLRHVPKVTRVVEPPSAAAAAAAVPERPLQKVFFAYQKELVEVARVLKRIVVKAGDVERHAIVATLLPDDAERSTWVRGMVAAASEADALVLVHDRRIGERSALTFEFETWLTGSFESGADCVPVFVGNEIHRDPSLRSFDIIHMHGDEDLLKVGTEVLRRLRVYARRQFGAGARPGADDAAAPAGGR